MVDTTPTPHCPKCGTPNRTGARYCVECGTYMSDPAGGTTVSLERQAGEELERHVREATAGVYEIERELGRGGMAAVYLATEIALNRKVAIKILPPEFTFGEGMIERFEREARTAAQLDHPNIIPIYRVDAAGRLLYFAMKYVEGRSLADILHDRGALPVPTVTGILEAVGSALAYAHERGVIHRDVKPANILVDRQGVVLVSDFGIAKTSQEATITKSGVVIGTPQYMSPEQCVGKRLTPASDQYSLGVVGFEMLSGNVPFDADSAVQLLQMHITQPPPPLHPLRPEAPRDLVKAIEHTMLKEPERRFPNMNEFTEAIELIRATEQHTLEGRAQLRALAVGATLSGLRVVTPISGPSQVRTKRRTPLVVGAAVAAAAVAAIGIWRVATPARDEFQPGVEATLSEDRAATEDTADTASQGPGAETDSAVAQAEAAADSVQQQPATQPATTTPTAPRPQPPQRATLVLEGIPEDAIAIVDGNRVQGGRVTLAGGAHVVGVVATGYQNFEQQIMLRAGETRRFAPPLTPLAQEPGQLSVGSLPTGDLYIDRQLIGELPVRGHPIPAGEHQIRIEAMDTAYVPFDTLINVQPGDTVNLRLIRLRRRGS